eukprot:NODE_2666_length_1147_cov_25.912568_g2444_i0.p1 GENE.NODE_2666_length_1147_cov_25.912568_g2444_i0~~NODE_2666_length_1147_cov_25.912568_g2444_i0.p1  ORF type:complete len:300 (+),score=61.04 NODE_2666_length_1147_cov_25.912568_g2444_i0:159-1058(+)
MSGRELRKRPAPQASRQSPHGVTQSQRSSQRQLAAGASQDVIPAKQPRSAASGRSVARSQQLSQNSGGFSQQPGPSQVPLSQSQSVITPPRAAGTAVSDAELLSLFIRFTLFAHRKKVPVRREEYYKHVFGATKHAATTFTRLLEDSRRFFSSALGYELHEAKVGASNVYFLTLMEPENDAGVEPTEVEAAELGLLGMILTALALSNGTVAEVMLWDQLASQGLTRTSPLCLNEQGGGSLTAAEVLETLVRQAYLVRRPGKDDGPVLRMGVRSEKELAHHFDAQFVAQWLFEPVVEEAE